MKWLLWSLTLVLAIYSSVVTVKYSLQFPQIVVYNNIKNVLESEIDKRFINWDEITKTLNELGDDFASVYATYRVLVAISAVLWLAVIFWGMGMALWRWFN